MWDFRSISRANKLRALALLAVWIHQPAAADRNGDEDETLYEVDFNPGFRIFHKIHGRYPKSWIELGEQSSCTGYDVNQRKNFPRAGDSLIWRPRLCELSYRIDYSNKNSFRIVALSEGHIVSINNTFKIRYVKTQYHDHNPRVSSPNEQE